MIQLQRYFGLRTKESIELRPWRATAMGPDHLYVTDGTKGGKHRMIPIRSDRQRAVILAAKEIVGNRLNTQLRWPDTTWRQAQSHFYYLMRCLGATHEQLGVSPHGLRHGFLQDEYEYYAGVPAPLKGVAENAPRNLRSPICDKSIGRVAAPTFLWGCGAFKATVKGPCAGLSWAG